METKNWTIIYSQKINDDSKDIQTDCYKEAKQIYNKLINEKAESVALYDFEGEFVY